MKMGCIGVGALATAGLVGCAAEPSSNSSNDHRAQEEEASSSSNAQHGSSSATQEEPASSDRATAVVFFSRTGNTEAAADKVAQAADGELMRIEAAEPYTAQDLDYNSDCRANSEQENGSTRPALASPIPDIAGFDTVYLGYPIWWGKAPRVILAFLEGVDATGKRVIPFCTSGSNPISGSIDELHAAAPEAEWGEGRRFASNASQQEIDAWVEEAR